MKKLACLLMICPSALFADNWSEFSERCLRPVLDGGTPIVNDLTLAPATTELDGASLSEAFPTATTYIDPNGGFEMAVFPTEQGPGVACVMYALPGAPMDVSAYEAWIDSRVAAGELYEDKGGILRGSYQSRGANPKSRVSGLYGTKDGVFAGLFSVAQYLKE